MDKPSKALFGQFNIHSVDASSPLVIHGPLLDV